MITVYRSTDRIKIKIGEAEIIVSPLTYYQKTAINGMLGKEAGQIRESAIKVLYQIMKYSIKEVSGISYLDGSNMTLTFEEGFLSEESIEELLNMEISNELSTVLYRFLNGVPKDSEMEDVQIIPIEGIAKKK